MTIQVETESEILEEQINDNISEYIFNSVKSILGKDEFGLFNLKASQRLNDNLDQVNESIQKLIKINSEQEERNHKISERITSLNKKIESKCQLILTEMDK